MSSRNNVDYARNPLTHHDVRAVQFSEQRKGFNEREVVEFLENVAESLYGLHWQNSELIQQRDEMAAKLQALETNPADRRPESAVEATQLMAPVPAGPWDAPTPPPGTVAWDTTPVEQPAADQMPVSEPDVAPAAEEPAVEAAAAADAPAADVSMASLVRTLELAQRTADALLAEAREQAAALVAEAEEKSAALIADAEQKAATFVADAEREQADLVAATDKARQVEADARYRATAGLRAIVAAAESAIGELNGE